MVTLRRYFLFFTGAGRSEAPPAATEVSSILLRPAALPVTLDCHGHGTRVNSRDRGGQPLVALDWDCYDDGELQLPSC